MVVAPFLLVFVTPLLARCRVIQVEMPSSFFGESAASLPRRGEWIDRWQGRQLASQGADKLASFLL